MQKGTETESVLGRLMDYPQYNPMKEAVCHLSDGKTEIKQLGIVMGSAWIGPVTNLIFDCQQVT